MSTFALLAILVTSIVVSLGIYGVCLWLMARCSRLPHVGIGRAMAAMVIIAGTNIGLEAIYFGLSSSVLASRELPRALLALAALVLWFYLGYAIVKKMFRARAGQALLVFVATGVLTCIIGYSGAVAIRAGLVEAFVVPTGSEAIAILGQHFDVKCPNCGYRFAIESAATDDRDDRVVAVCPNCGQTIQLDRGAPSVQGDRIIVDKTATPRRWEIAAFLAPTGKATYVKRVVALPGETLSLAGGHVYIDGVEIHKGPDAETDLWVPVNDTHFVASTDVPKALHWDAAGSRWTAKDGQWACQEANADELLLRGTITDSLAYNEQFALQLPAPIPVGDIKLECSIGSFAGTGSVGVRWAFGGHRFSVDITGSGDATLETIPAGKAARHAASVSKCKLSRPISSGQLLAVAVRDGRGYLLENSRAIGSVAIEDESLERRDAKQLDAAGDEASSCKLSIVARQCDVVLSRIALFRDVYFRSADEMGEMESIGPGPYKLSQDEFFVIGDNCALSRDSRAFGPIKANSIRGVARWIYWPPQRWHTFQ